MTPPTAAQLDLARQLVAREEVGDDATTAAGRVYDKLDGLLAPLIGHAGVRAVFVRSAKVAGIAPEALESSTRLRAHLETLAPDASRHAAEVVVAAFLGLLATFIGQRLMTEVLRRAWPSTEPPAGDPSHE